MDKKAIVNSCLIAIGNERVISLDDPDVETDMAIAHVENSLINILCQGWWFNTEFNWKLDLMVDNTALVPAGFLSFKPAGIHQNLPLVARSGKLWHLKDHTYDMSKYSHDNSITVDCTLSLDIEQLPAVALELLRCEARLRMLEDTGESDAKIKRAVAYRREALGKVQREQLRWLRMNGYSSNVVEGFLQLASSHGTGNVTGVRFE